MIKLYEFLAKTALNLNTHASAQENQLILTQKPLPNGWPEISAVWAYTPFQALRYDASRRALRPAGSVGSGAPAVLPALALPGHEIFLPSDLSPPKGG